MSFDLFTWLSFHKEWSLFQNSLKPFYSETVSDSAVPCYNQIHISKLVSQPSYTIRNSSFEVGRRGSGHESGNARKELLGSLSLFLSHEVDGVAQHFHSVQRKLILIFSHCLVQNLVRYCVHSACIHVYTYMFIYTYVGTRKRYFQM